MTEPKRPTAQEFEDQLLAREAEGRVNTESAMQVRKAIASTPKKAPKLSKVERFQAFYDQAFEEGLAGIDSIPESDVTPEIAKLRSVKAFYEQRVSWVTMDRNEVINNVFDYQDKAFLAIAPSDHPMVMKELLAESGTSSTLALVRLSQIKVTKRMAALMLTSGLASLMTRLEGKRRGIPDLNRQPSMCSEDIDMRIALADFWTDGGFSQEVERIRAKMELETDETLRGLKKNSGFFAEFKKINGVLFPGEPSPSKQEIKARTELYYGGMQRAVVGFGIDDPDEAHKAHNELLWEGRKHQAYFQER